MGVFKNGVGRPSNETIKKRNIFKGICVLLVLIIIGMTVYILNDKGIINISSKDDKKTVDKKTDKETTKESEKIEVSKEESKKTLENYVYNQYNNLVNDFSEDYKIVLAVEKTEGVKRTNTCKELFGNDINFEISSSLSFFIKDKGICYDDYEIDTDYSKFYSYESVNKTYEKLFGKAMKKKTVESPKNNTSVIYGYSKSKDGYVELSCECGDLRPEEINYIYDSYEMDNKLHIIFSYYTYFSDGPKAMITLTDANENKIEVNSDGKGNMLESTKDIFEKNKDSVAKFDFILNKDSNGNYIFGKIEKVK